jgi:CRP-like cAMP-binding protein
VDKNRTLEGLRTNTTPAMAGTPNARQNGLLAILPEPEYKRIAPRLELVGLSCGDALYGSGNSLIHVYFPTTAIVSMLSVLVNGASSEIAMVGNIGVVGVALFMGGDTMPTRAIVRNSGYAYRLETQVLRDEFNRAGALQHLLLRYTLALMIQMAQTAVCNRYHTVEQQLCRWLLLTLDRLPSKELRATQELIAEMLGVRRESVVAVAGKLQCARLIHYTRGRISVIDRSGLEERVCECYEVLRKEYRRLLLELTAGRASSGIFPSRCAGNPGRW